MSLITRDSLRPVDPVLAGLVIGSFPNSKGLVSSQVPQITVDGASAKGQIFVMPSAAFLGAGDVNGLERRPGAEMQPVTVEGPSTVSYEVRSLSCEVGPIPVENVEENLSPLQLDAYFASVAATALRLAEEKKLADQMFSTTTGWTTTSTIAALGGGGVQWNAPGAKPTLDVETMIDLFRTNTNGGEPRDAVIGYSLAQSARNSAEFKAIASGMRLSDSAGPLAMTWDMLSQIFATQWNLNLIVGRGRRRTNNPGVATASEDIWGDAIWIGNLKGQAMPWGGMNVGVTEAAAAIIRRSDISLETEWIPRRRSWMIYADMRSIEKVLDVTQGVYAYDGNA